MMVAMTMGMMASLYLVIPARAPAKNLPQGIILAPLSKNNPFPPHGRGCFRSLPSSITQFAP